MCEVYMKTINGDREKVKSRQLEDIDDHSEGEGGDYTPTTAVMRKIRSGATLPNVTQCLNLRRGSAND